MGGGCVLAVAQVSIKSVLIDLYGLQESIFHVEAIEEDVMSLLHDPIVRNDVQALLDHM